MDKNIQKYELIQDGRKYIISTEIIENNVRLICVEVNKDKPPVFLNDFSLNYLRELSKSFYTTLTIRDAQDLINKTIESQKVSIENNQNSLNVLLFLLDQNINTILTLKPNVEITYSPPKYLPTKYIYHQTEYIKRPTVHTIVQNNYYSNDENPYLLRTPKIDKLTLSLSPQRNINNISQQTIIQSPPPKYKTYIENSSPIIQGNYYNQLSPQREQIEYYIPGSPSTAQINYTTFSSNKSNKYLLNPQNEYLPINHTQTIFSNNSFESDSQKIIELQNETNKIKGEHEILKDKTKKLIEQIEQLNNQILILKEENKNLRENKDANLNSNQIYEITILKQEVERISKQLSELQNEKDYEYRKTKENEINLYKSQINELLKDKNNLELENKNLRLQNQELSKRNYKTEYQYQNLLESQKYYDYYTKAPLEIVKGEIIENNQELEFLTRKICNENKKLTLSLLYKATVDSDKAAAFHNKCDNAKSSIVLIKSGNGKRFGGFTSCNWKGNSQDKKDDKAFIFSLDKMQIYDIIPGEDAIGCYPKYGPVFLGCQIRIYDDAFTNGGTTFEKGLNYYTKEDYELTGGLRQFEVKEIEVYSVEFE